MDKIFSPKNFEEKIYKKWIDNGCFLPDDDKQKKTFTIVMPPPNITGQLHMGHALNNTVQDVIVRYKRMCGHSTLWLPGTDHASIATEVKVMNKLREETGKSKEEIGRDLFLKRAYEWKEQYGGKICEQLKRLGSSCDWSRLAFTMDEKCSKAVKTVFVNLYNKGLIYKGNRMVNWCPSCKTALSDAEVEYEEQDTSLWHIKYPLVDGSGEIIVATTRPETIFGDMAVAVNAGDSRYQHLIGKKLRLPLTHREIPIIADDYVDVEFGTGAVKITPAHDPNDFEVGKRHNLDVLSVIADNGLMNENAGKFAGLDRLDARQKVVKELSDNNFLQKTEAYSHNVGVCYRCHTAIEPALSNQWFVKMEPLAKPAIEAGMQGKVKFIPQRFEKIYYNWMTNIKDWCISRQLWWGHRIPCWYCNNCGKEIVSIDTPNQCNSCGCHDLYQDEDVLDTWFSSALWPFSTLGYPENTDDYNRFYPTNLLVTAYDIIFFWVARMIFSGIEHTGKVPFPDVLIHGIVRDAQGRKMSKSLGNGIDPLEIIENYGADALRFSLILGVANGMDIRYSDDKIEGARNFMNKIWNASRYVKMQIEGRNIKDIKDVNYTEPDKWILKKLDEVIQKTRELFEKYEMGLALAGLYDFVWSDFCDWYIELTKSIFYQDDDNAKDEASSVLYYVFTTILKLCHPFIPFITEEIWDSFESSILMMQDYPESERSFQFQDDKFNVIKDIIEKIRSVRADIKVAKSVTFPIFIKLYDPMDKEVIEINKAYIQKLAGVKDINFIEDKEQIKEKVSQCATNNVEIFIPLGQLVDFDKEMERINKELEKVEQEITKREAMLSNDGFISKAPKTLVETEKNRLEESKKLKEKLLTQLQNLK